ncbi:MAG: hypothetical protein FWH20_00195 [Oscillospiraceae bacterium]|nr:hypothetical protein [Oscillospiraceae bacterium]
MKLKLKLTLLTLATLINFTACDADFNTEAELHAMLKFAMEIGFESVGLESQDHASTVYNYLAEDGVKFTATSYLYRTDYSIRDRIGIKFDYPLKWFGAKQGEVERIVGDLFEYDFHWFGMIFFVNHQADLEPLSELIHSLLTEFEPISVNADGKDYYYHIPHIFVYALEANPNLDELQDSYHIDDMGNLKDPYFGYGGTLYSSRPEHGTFLNDTKGFLFPIIGEESLTVDEIFDIMQGNLLTAVEQGLLQDFGVEEEMFADHPKSYLANFVINGEVILLRRFSYVEDLDDYCMDFTTYRYVGQDTVYSYTLNEGSFREVIEALGGELTIEESAVEWVIGENTWRAELTLVDVPAPAPFHETDTYEHIAGFAVYKNGEESPLPLSRASAFGAFCFTIPDLELIFGSEVIIERANGRVVINN